MPYNRRSYNKTHSIALSGLLFALAMALSFIEGTLEIGKRFSRNAETDLSS